MGLLVLLCVFAATSAPAGQERRTDNPRPLTPADYARAERFLAPAINPLVIGGQVSANWLPGDVFWYRYQVPDGYEFILVDPVARSRRPAFDHARLAAALSTAAKGTYTAHALPFRSIAFSSDMKSVSFDLDARRWRCDVAGRHCAEVPAEAAAPETAAAGRQGRRGQARIDVPSPDGRMSAFIRDWNLWVRNLATGQERQLTSDGEKDFGYATDNAGWSSSDRAIVLWSPDSKRIATYQQDERKVGEMYLVNTPVSPVTHPSLRVSKFPLPGDATVAMLHRVIVDAGSGHVVRLQMPPDFHRATLGDDVSLDDWKWSPDGRQFAFISTSRDHKEAVLRVADASTGSVRTVMSEKVATQYESRIGCQILWSSGEVLWYSERDNWGHLYLYDLATGALKRQVTSGDGPVMQMLRLDEQARTVWFEAQGRERGEDPYFRHAYRVGLDGSGYTSLTPLVSDHAVQISPSGRFVIDTYSQPDQEPAIALRDGNGKFVMMIEKADISRLRAIGWQPPMPIRMKAHDGKTDIYGLLFRPTNFDPARKYPIVNNVYPGPQTGSTGSRAFAAARGDRQALAELGFIVVTIDGMGTPGRSKAFQDAYYGAMGRDNTIPDQIAGMKELAARFPWIDLSRAGIWGHSGGGFATTTAMFRFPGFFQAGIAESGNHDQRLNEDDWGERYQGLVTRGADGTDSYAAEANEAFAKNLQGHLLLAHGTMDTNVPPYQTMLVADALIKANKDFDLLLLPNQNHGYGSASAYMMRRRWDYFVKWLVGVEPPKEYRMDGAPTPPPREPTRADILRGGWGDYRANNRLVSYALDIRVDPAKQSIAGRNTITFRMLADGSRIQLDLTDALQVDRILLGATPLRYEREAGAVFVDFPSALRKGQVYAIDFYYSGQPKATGRFGGFTFGKDPAGRPWINTACEGIGASIWWPNKDQWREEPEEMRLSVAIPERPGGRLEREVPRQDRPRRRLHALGLADSLPDQQLRRLAQHRALRALLRHGQRPDARLLLPAGEPREGEEAVRPGEVDDRGLRALLRALPVRERRLQAHRGSLLGDGAPVGGHLRQPLRERLSRARLDGGRHQPALRLHHHPRERARVVRQRRHGRRRRGHVDPRGLGHLHGGALRRAHVGLRRCAEVPRRLQVEGAQSRADRHAEGDQPDAVAGPVLQGGALPEHPAARDRQRRAVVRAHQGRASRSSSTRTSRPRTWSRSSTSGPAATSRRSSTST